MTSIWVESLGRSYTQALDLLQAAVQNCPDELWQEPMWAAPDGQPPEWGTPWLRAWHALEVLDYDLTGELAPWKPPPPFDTSMTGDVSRVWTRAEILGYLEWCRERVRTTLDGITDERAATPLPPSHRYRGQPHAWHLASIPSHTVEHSAQIQQFVNDRRSG
jgi:hypothetical protein